MSEIEPVLSATEWAHRHHLIQCFDSWDMFGPVGVAEIKAGPDYLHLTSHQHALVADFSAPADRLGLAALCLHGRISWDMVDALRGAATAELASQRMGADGGTLHLIADLIESLLPPRGP